MEDAEVLELYELNYSDIMILSSTNPSSSSPEELEKIELMTRTVMETLGPRGPGLLAITGVPNASELREELLPLARKLALLDHESRKRILKEHNLGSDVPLKNPGRSVSSFAMQLRYSDDRESTESKQASGVGHSLHPEENNHDFEESCNKEFKNLGSTFRELGFCMMELGLRLAQICDKAIGGNELEQSLLESYAAKGRLIHYHSLLDGLLLKEVDRSRSCSKKANNNKRDQDYLSSRQKPSESSNACDVKSSGIHSNLWQQWHYDYGIFTVLTAPLFLLPSYSLTTETEESCVEKCSSPIGHTCLQIFDPNQNKILMAKAPPESFIIQVGESADIISKGKLCSTLHSVSRPTKLESLSRETFVVFLQPAWNKTFSISDYPQTNWMFEKQCLVTSEKELQLGRDECKPSQEIQRIVPPLSSRLKDGMTFAEFSKETTKQYYGGSGLQSNRC
ncbi:hypothetical protein L6164_010058 [Bauhinia variegata]|uniref:Uncharacterized protein n=1 Tax=Bauhinia variegata TaxID=167791 RepID=A0ACB9PN68_BAUVA|nr:hypothetical protein L6164_010058 [Bauhinia variegata]